MPKNTPTVEAVLLCIGPENGVIVLAPDEEEASPETLFLGKVDSLDSAQACLELAREVADELELPVLIVAEQGSSWDWWRTKIAAREGVPAVPVDSTWRRQTFGPRYPRSRERAKQKAQAYLVHALDLPSHGPDIAETVCLGIWASRSESIRKKLKEAA